MSGAKVGRKPGASQACDDAACAQLILVSGLLWWFALHVKYG
jgi:hypothetical protein